MSSKSCRRSCILMLVVLLCSTLSAAKANKKSAAGSYIVYVGTYTDKTESKGIYAFRFNAVTGRATTPSVAATSVNPSFLAVDRGAKYLYAVNELSNFQGKNSGGVSAFAIDRKTSKLTALNQVASRGAGPCHVAVDRSGKYVLVANYDSGSLAVFSVLPDGRLGEASAFIQNTGHGPNPERQEGPHAHEMVLSADNRFVVAVDLGLDKLFLYRFDQGNGRLAANEPPFVTVDGGSGPRHFAFDPAGKWAYVLEEMASKITGFSYDAASGVLHKIDTVSALPADFHGPNDAAEIEIDAKGKFLYASNRGHDSIAVFSINTADGSLKLVEFAPTRGKTPRHFALDPTGRYLLAANQESNNIAIFTVDRKTGRLKFTGRMVKVPSPVMLQFVAH
jgi:6-phosphogluconolactonase